MTVPADVTVVGIGADGWAGLAEPGRAAVRAAEVVLGGPRQLALVAGHTDAEPRAWPSPMLPALPELFAGLRGRRVCALASGDPMFHGLGATLARRARAGRSRCCRTRRRCRWPAPGWAGRPTSVEVVSAVARPLAAVRRVLAPGARVLVLSEGAATPAALAALLADDGWGDSALTVLEQLGGPAERRLDGTARRLGASAGRPAEPRRRACVADRAGPRHARASPTTPTTTTASSPSARSAPSRSRCSAPRRGELLWDVGAGNGSIAMEWLRAHPTCRAVAVEPDPARAARIAANADALGVPGVRVVAGRAPDALDGLPTPDAVFIGGGVTADGVLPRCWDGAARRWAAGRQRRHRRVGGGARARRGPGSAASSPGCPWPGPRRWAGSPAGARPCR